MANEKHLEILFIGVEHWNYWQERNPDIRPALASAELPGVNLYEVEFTNADLRGANLSGASLENAELTGGNLSGANLSGAYLANANFEATNVETANFTDAFLKGSIFIDSNLDRAVLQYAVLQYANLEHADLRGANLEHADLRGANLEHADLRGANLEHADLRGANLEHAVLQYANLEHADLRGAFLQDANFTNANFVGVNLTGVDLTGVNLTGVDLTDARLIGVQALITNFKNAILTGACIEDWNINSQTNLRNVRCDYIYLKENYSTRENKCIFGDRRPHDPNKIFAPGEFTKLFQKAFDTVDLLFQNGVDWQAVAYSLKNIQVLNEDTPLAIQKIENKGDGDVLISVNVPENVDKGKFEGGFWQGYEFAQKSLEGQYQARLDDKDKEINRLFYLVNQQRELIGDRNIHGNYYEQSGNFGIGHNDNSHISGDATVAGKNNEAE